MSGLAGGIVRVGKPGTVRTLDELHAEIEQCQRDLRALDGKQPAQLAELYEREFKLWLAVDVAARIADTDDTTRLLAAAAGAAAVAALGNAQNWRRRADARTNASTSPVPV